MKTETLPKTNNQAPAEVENQEVLSCDLEKVDEVLDLVGKIEFPELLIPYDANPTASELARQVHGDFDPLEIRQLQGNLEALSELYEGELPCFEEFIDLIADSLFEKLEAPLIAHYQSEDPVFEQAVKISKISGKNPSDEQILLNGCFAYNLFLFSWFMAKEPETMAKWARLYVYLVA